MSLLRSVSGSCLTLLAAGLLVLGFGPGCATPSQEPSPAAVPPAASPAGEASIDEIRVGEKITVSITDIPRPITHQQQVREDGTIQLPLDVTVVAAGKRKNELQEEIRKAYVPRYYNRATVVVETEERFIYVDGQVRMPGRYAFTGEMTVLRAISVAGGFTEFANKRNVTLIRPGGKKITVDCKRAEQDPRHDVPIFPGDSVLVKRKFW
jgi:protein involved in polysaccharide export with SLBB domain